MMIGQLRRWLRQQSNARRRRLDTEVLWPQVLYQAGHLQELPFLCTRR
jgi:hypothetical protein